MPRSTSTSISAESLSALLAALGLPGLEETEYHEPKAVKSLNDISCFKSNNFLSLSPETQTNAVYETSISTANDVEYFGKEHVADFDIYLGPEEENIPSFRPKSSIRCWELIRSSVDGLSPTPSLIRPSITQHTGGNSYIQMKVAFNASIIMLRAPRDISFVGIRGRLRDKFVNQEKVPLSHTFSILLVRQPPITGCEHSERSEIGHKHVSFASCVDMRFIDDEEDWSKITSSNNGHKITLRVLDTPL